MNQLNKSTDRKDPSCILPILGEDPGKCNQKDICLLHYECQPRDALRVVLDIPTRFSKAILIIIDMQAEIYRYLDYIGAKGVTDTKEGFTNEQCNAMFNHYGVDEEGKPGKARSIIEYKGILYDIYQNYKNGKSEPKLLEFDKSDDKCIRWEFPGEKAVGIPIPWGSDIVPVLILCLKNKIENEAKEVQEVKEFVEDRERSLKVRLIIKNTRMESLGKLVSAIPPGDKPENDPRGKFSRWLLAWLEEHDGLWLGNKLWFVVDHELIHAKNLWKLANDLAREANLGENLKKLGETNPLIFSLAIWLHDIGYKGIHLPEWKMKLMDTRPDHIINDHCIISAALILKQHESYNLNEFDETIRARASLVCAYHQKGNPITTNELEKGTNIPIKLKIKSNKFVKEMINKSGVLKKGNDDYLILENLSFKENNNEKSLKVMASLLRFLDSCDFNRNRVGSPSMIKLRESVCNDNASPQKVKFKKPIRSCFDKAMKIFNKSTDDKKLRFNKEISSLNKLISKGSIPENMEDEGLKALDKLSDLFTNAKEKKKIEETYYLGRYVGLLNQQVKYYEVHNFVVSVSFKKNENENGFVDLEYKVDEKILSKNDKIKSSDTAEKVIKDFISKKTKVVYEEILRKENILKIKCVKPFSANFDDWIQDDKQH